MKRESHFSFSFPSLVVRRPQNEEEEEEEEKQKKTHKLYASGGEIERDQRDPEASKNFSPFFLLLSSLVSRLSVLPCSDNTFVARSAKRVSAYILLLCFRSCRQGGVSLRRGAPRGARQAVRVLLLQHLVRSSAFSLFCFSKLSLVAALSLSLSLSLSLLEKLFFLFSFLLIHFHFPEMHLSLFSCVMLFSLAFCKRHHLNIPEHLTCVSTFENREDFFLLLFLSFFHNFEI